MTTLATTTMQPIHTTTFVPTSFFSGTTNNFPTTTPKKYSKMSRKERRRIQRNEIEQALSDGGNNTVYVLLSQLQAVETTTASKNVNVATNIHRVIFHLSIQNARQLAKTARTSRVIIRPDFKRGMGQGQVGTQFSDCFLRARPMKSSRVQLVEFAEHNAELKQKTNRVVELQKPKQSTRSMLTESTERLFEGAEILLTLQQKNTSLPTKSRKRSYDASGCATEQRAFKKIKLAPFRSLTGSMTTLHKSPRPSAFRAPYKVTLPALHMCH